MSFGAGHYLKHAEKRSEKFFVRNEKLLGTLFAV